MLKCGFGGGHELEVAYGAMPVSLGEDGIIRGIEVVIVALALALSASIHLRLGAAPLALVAAGDSQASLRLSVWWRAIRGSIINAIDGPVGNGRRIWSEVLSDGGANGCL